LRRFAEKYELLPDHITIRGEIEVSDKVVISGGFGDVRSGMYRGRPVAVKTTRVTTQGNLLKIKRVSTTSIFIPYDPN